MSFELLSEPVRRYIRDKRWEELRPIQNAAISKILTTDANYILASRTASGKTEAAFLPILSKVNFNSQGVQVMYISPLIALINDQFLRIEELCKYLDVTITKWHGEANKTKKEKLVSNPSGIVLITPESLEAMFVHKPYAINAMFSNLKFIVIDEIHSFIGNDRGTQLTSLLSRVRRLIGHSPIVVGLSATIGDYQAAKQITGDAANTKVLLDRTSKEIDAVFRYFKSENQELPLELLKDLYQETKDNKVLIFPNSRGRAEEIAVKLKKISDRIKGHPNYFSHHSSVDKEVREFVEYFAKTNQRQNFCIACTSTLELGIDIGTVDEVVQIDATSSISSLIQRVGRSGRRHDQASKLFLYATRQWSLLQSLACWALFKEGFIEPPAITQRPYDIALHQALSVVKGYSGIPIEELKTQLKQNSAFQNIDPAEINEIVNHLIATDLLEKLQQEVIIGVEGEKIVNSRDFYTVFKPEDNFKVINAGRVIGDVPYSLQIIEGENILLAARIWKIQFVDASAKKIEVVPAKDGKRTIFFGDGAIVHSSIRQKMLEILFSDTTFEELEHTATNELNEMRKEFSAFQILDPANERPVLVDELKTTLFTFSGTRSNRTISFLLSLAGIKHDLDESSSSFELDISNHELIKKWPQLDLPLKEIDSHIERLIETKPDVLSFSKWGPLLPKKYQIALIEQRYFDLQAIDDIKNFRFIANKG